MCANYLNANAIGKRSDYQFVFNTFNSMRTHNLTIAQICLLKVQYAVIIKLEVYFMRFR